MIKQRDDDNFLSYCWEQLGGNLQCYILAPPPNKMTLCFGPRCLTSSGPGPGRGQARKPVKTIDFIRFLYGGTSPATPRQLAGNSPATRGPNIWAPAEDLDNKNPSLVALGKIGMNSVYLTHFCG